MKRVLFWRSAVLIILLIGAVNLPISQVKGEMVRGYVFVTKWGTPGSGLGQFNEPTSVAVDKNGNVYVADTNNNRIQKFDSNGTYLTQWGSNGTDPALFEHARSPMHPYGVAVDSSGNVYVSDTGNDRVLKFGSDGSSITKWGGNGNGDGQLRAPNGITVDSSGYIYVVDTGNNRVQKFTPSGSYVAKWIGPQGTISLFGVAVDNSGAVYVTDMARHIAWKYNPDGSLSSGGIWGAPGSGDGQFQYPYGLATDGTIAVFVADAGNNRIQRWGLFYIYALSWGTRGTDDAQFKNPKGVAVDSSGNVYVADTGNNRIQKFAPTYYGILRIFVQTQEGTPLGGASVVSTTQPNGQAALSGVSKVDGSVLIFKWIIPGDYTIQASLAGYIPSTQTYNVPDGGTTEKIIKLQSESQKGSIKVTVKDKAGAPIDGAVITSIAQPSSQAALNGNTGSDGAVAFSSVLSGSYTLQASKSGYNSGSAQGTVAGDTIEITITLMPAQGNQPPAASDDSYSVNQDVQLAVGVAGVLKNDLDPEGSNLSAHIESSPIHGTLLLKADGSYTYTPSSGFYGTDSFTYRANDGSADSNIAVVTITVKQQYALKINHSTDGTTLPSEGDHTYDPGASALITAVPNTNYVFDHWVIVGEAQTTNANPLTITMNSNKEITPFFKLGAGGAPSCIIATATFGSELNPEVQFLRGFRDNTVLSTFAGSNFMVAFNAFYYSFSPQVAKVIAGNELLRGVMKVILYPLIAILHLSSSIFYTFSNAPEVAIIVTGLTASSLIAAVYLLPPILLLNHLKKIRSVKNLNWLMVFIWFGSIMVILLSEYTISPTLMMVSSGAFVIATMYLATFIIGSTLKRIVRNT